MLGIVHYPIHWFAGFFRLIWDRLSSGVATSRDASRQQQLRSLSSRNSGIFCRGREGSPRSDLPGAHTR
jgi:hypothetical protein